MFLDTFPSSFRKVLLKNISFLGLQARKRFYKKVSTVQSNKDFEIILDNRKLKTPAGSIFRVSSEPLALAVANEWDAQEEKVLVSSMHLVSYGIRVLVACCNLINKFIC
jgi:chaperone required for assembly of F1-ATPase